MKHLTNEQKLELIRKEFVGNVSHELKTPLTLIKGCIETLAKTIPDPTPIQKEFLSMIERHADRLNAIIDDLLMLSKIERIEESKGLRTSSASFLDVVKNAVDVCRGKATHKSITLLMSLPDTDIQGDINASLLEQALVNFIDNAIKYSPSNTTVDVRLIPGSKAIRIDVVDRGMGIAKADLPHIFERFYRVDKARSRELGGTGLGLAIVKHIVQAHGGSVSVESEPEHGSTFSMSIPF